MKKYITIIFTIVLIGICQGEDDLSKQYENTNKPFSFHGRLSLYNGSPSFRIWIIGTNRIVGVLGEDTDSACMPKKLEDLFTSFFTDIYADFSVSPISKYKKGHMQMVKITSVKNIVVYQNEKFVNKIKKLSSEPMASSNSDSAVAKPE